MDISLSDILDDYRNMDISLRDYFLGGVLPAVAVFILIVFFPHLIYPDLFLRGFLSLFTRYVLPSAILIIAVLFPIIYRKLKEEEIDSYLHLFITYFWAISTSAVSTTRMIKKLSEVEEYEALCDELQKIYNRMEYWDMPLPEAARDVAEETPSERLSDFLRRLAHSQEAGENLSTFLEKEHSVVMKDYETEYRASLETLELIKEVFIALMTSTLFLIVFLSILPIFGGGSALLLLSGGLVVFVIMEVVMAVAVKSVLPNDPIWHKLDKRPPLSRRLKKVLPITAVGGGVLFYLTTVFTQIDLFWRVSLALTPLLIPGLMTFFSEKELKRSDDNYDAFMRAIASSTAMKGGNVENALAKLRQYDFGPLTEEIENLYKRLLTRIDEEKAWRFFAAGTGSNLIATFTNIYTGSRDLGAEVRTVSDIISDTFVSILSLRKDRYQQSSSMIGIFYGLGLGAALSLTLTLNISVMMDESLGMIAETPQFSDIMHQVGYTPEMIQFFIMIAILVHAVFASLSLVISAGSHKMSALYHMVGMTWIGVVASVIGRTVMGGLIGVG